MDTTYDRLETLLGTALAPIDRTQVISLVFIFSLLMALAAQIMVPLGPVPLTAQTLVVLLAGALLGSRLGAAAMILYLAEGVFGLPFYAGGASGIAHLLGPTGGYLVAFPAAAFITGAFAENGWDRQFSTAVVAMAVGSIVIILSGWLWLMVSTNTQATVAFQLTVLPFVVGDVIKIFLAAALLPSGWALLRRLS